MQFFDLPVQPRLAHSPNRLAANAQGYIIAKLGQFIMIRATLKLDIDLTDLWQTTSQQCKQSRIDYELFLLRDPILHSPLQFAH
jgi:hypothetical protein